jgi:hypothetical protein
VLIASPLAPVLVSDHFGLCSLQMRSMPTMLQPAESPSRTFLECLKVSGGHPYSCQTNREDGLCVESETPGRVNAMPCGVATPLEISTLGSGLVRIAAQAGCALVGCANVHTPGLLGPRWH